jgi:chromosome segregation protein
VREDAGPRPCSAAARPEEGAETPSEPRGDEGARGRHGRRDRDHARRQGDQAPDAAVRRREVADRARVPVRGLPRRPCPFYILDEVEAALDDLNIDRFLTLLRRFADRAQFIVVTHQKRTMEAADCLYGVSMAGDGVSKVVSARSPATPALRARA